MTDTTQTRPTILYVDDEEMACKYFARAVGSEYEVLSAISADDAVGILRAHHARISVLVTDFRMPGRDGGDLLVGDEARRTMATHKPPDFDAPPTPTTATAAVPGEARFGSAGQPAVAPTPEGAEVAAAGSRLKPRR